ncbi:uncharacterized protein ACIBXB_013711 [Morphnus guianensis]
MILKVSSNINDSMISTLDLLSGQWFNALSSSFLSCAPSPGTDTSAPSAALCPPNLCSFPEHRTPPPLCSLGLDGCSWMRASSSGSENHTTPQVESMHSKPGSKQPQEEEAIQGLVCLDVGHLPRWRCYNTPWATISRLSLPLCVAVLVFPPLSIASGAIHFSEAFLSFSCLLVYFRCSGISSGSSTHNWQCPVHGDRRTVMGESRFSLVLYPGVGWDRVYFHKELEGAQPGQLTRTSQGGIRYRMMSCSVYNWGSWQWGWRGEGITARKWAEHQVLCGEQLHCASHALYILWTASSRVVLSCQLGLTHDILAAMLAN